MIVAALLLGGAEPVEAAERAFAAMAQTQGQWTAFRATAAADAIMFAPGKVQAQEFLAGRADPPRAVMWWPARTISACDGTLAISTGPWLRDGGRQHGTFTTIWRRQSEGGWKWVYDNGRETPAAVPAAERASASRASCDKSGGNRPDPAPPEGAVKLSDLLRRADGDVIVQGDGMMPTASPPDRTLTLGSVIAGGESADRSLAWQVRAAGSEGHILVVRRWSTAGWSTALLDISGVPAQ